MVIAESKIDSRVAISLEITALTDAVATNLVMFWTRSLILNSMVSYKIDRLFKTNINRNKASIIAIPTIVFILNENLNIFINSIYRFIILILSALTSSQSLSTPLIMPVLKPNRLRICLPSSSEFNETKAF